MAVKATIIMILFAVTNAVPVRDIPEFLHICRVNVPKYEACVVDSIEFLKPYLKVGVPEYNIPSLEPLKLKKLTIALTNTLQIQLTDVLANGASNFKVSNVKVAFKENVHVTVNVQLPNIQVEGKYDIDGKILLLPLRGSGPLHGNFSNCLGACKIVAERYIDENGVEKFRVKDFKLKITVGQGTVKLDNLFDGEQALGDIVNSTINNNFDLFMKELLPYVEKALSDAFAHISTSIVAQFSAAQLFPGAY
ncbi:circadian clock-controlled protein daywake [Linepithema humile]|uniref:circadian clock-controlled protein daywake n=1 Tax=Linepithema humile TaxID=83485 RepID=UPI000623957D|nr:PREDICTED: circadian clock-controlled protein [Linepithema humile]